MQTKTIKQALEEDGMTENIRDYQFEKERKNLSREGLRLQNKSLKN